MPVEAGLCPANAGGRLSSALCEALQKLSLVEYLLDELLGGDIQVRASVVIEYGEEVRNIEQRMAELAAADEAAAQNADEQHEISDEC